jgi:ABC-type transporter lipoprotein component MlaA
MAVQPHLHLYVSDNIFEILSCTGTSTYFHLHLEKKRHLPMTDSTEPYRRKHNRLNLQLDVTLNTPAGNCYKGITTNISFGGIMAHFKELPATMTGDDVSICLTFEKVNGEVINLPFNCRVVHKIDENIICLKFHRAQDIDRDRYNQFTSLMILNCTDAEELLEELFKEPTTLVSSSDNTT